MFESRATFTAPLSCVRTSAREIARARGFSLAELLIAVAIIAILAAIAVPSYRSYVMRGHRSDAEQLLTTIANREAQYLLDARDYTDQIGAGGLNLTKADGWSCTDKCTNDFYTVTVELGESPADGFTVSAVPTGSQAKDGTLTLTSGGSRSRKVSDVEKGW